MREIIKIGSVELTPDEAYQLYEQKKYIVTYSKIYQLFYSQAQKTVYGQQIYYCKGMARPGRFYVMTDKDVNRLVGYELVKAY